MLPPGKTGDEAWHPGSSPIPIFAIIPIPMESGRKAAIGVRTRHALEGNGIPTESGRVTR